MPLFREDQQRRIATHLTHVEDMVITDGLSGAKTTLRLLTSILGQMSGKSTNAVNMSVKMDGAPAIVCGKDPDDGQFFIGTKSVFNKTPKAAKTIEDIQQMYGDSGQELVDILTLVFMYLRPLPWSTVLQGDILFTPQLKSVRIIENVPHVTFQANVIRYAVPVDSQLGKRLQRAQLGITFHTVYTGSTLSSMTVSKSRIPDIQTGADVAILSNEYEDVAGTVTFTTTESRALQQLLQQLQKKTTLLSATQNKFLQLLSQHSLLKQEFMRFQNALVRQGKPITLTPKTFGRQFVLFLAMRQRELSNAKKDAKRNTAMAKFERDVIGREKDEKKRAALRQQFQRQLSQSTGPHQAIRTLSDNYKMCAQYVADHIQDVVSVIEWQQLVVDIKTQLLKKLDTPGFLSTYYDGQSGLVAGSHEGFVAVDHDGSMVKLVDRSEFSRLNFTTGRFQKS